MLLPLAVVPLLATQKVIELTSKMYNCLGKTHACIVFMDIKSPIPNSLYPTIYCIHVT